MEEMLAPPTALDQNRYARRRPIRWIAFVITVLIAGGTATGIYFGTKSLLLAVFVAPPAIGLFASLIYIGFSRYPVGTLIAFGCLAFIGLLAVFSFVDIFRHWTTASVFMGLALLVIPGLILLAKLVPALADYWNWNHKAFGGAIAGDLANFAGVVSLVNAHRAVSGDGWWWTAMFAGFLALVVGASLQWRWLRNNDSDQIVPMTLNLIVAVFTVVALFTDPPTPADQFSSPRWMVLSVWYVYLGALGIFWIILLFSNRVRVRLGVPNNRLSNQEKFWFAVSLIILYVMPIIALIVLPVMNLKNEIASLVLGGIGVLAWTLTELFSALRRTGRWAHNVEDWTSLISYLEWEKNWWEAVAGYAILTYIVADIVYKAQNANASLPQEYETILLLGLSLGFLGTLRGILKGIVAKPYKDVQHQIGSLRAANSTNQLQKDFEESQITL